MSDTEDNRRRLDAFGQGLFWGRCSAAGQLAAAAWEASDNGGSGMYAKHAGAGAAHVLLGDLHDTGADEVKTTIALADVEDLYLYKRISGIESAARSAEDTLFDLFTDDVQIYFPKYGLTRGKQGFHDFATGLLSSVSAMAHDLPNLNFIAGGDTVVVEGLTYGSDHEGRNWRGGATPGGRFCSVFEFSGDLISRMHIYLDPDYTGRDHDRFLWGMDRTW